MNTFLLCLCILSLTFCDYKNREERISVVSIALPSDAGTMDPLFTTDLSSRKLNSMVFRRLFRIEAGGKITGDLAEHYAWKNLNGLPALRIKLKHSFSPEGRLLSPEDVIYSLNRLRSESGPRKSEYQFIDHLKKISKNELEIYIKRKSSKALELLSLSFASIYDAKGHSISSTFISYGDFALEQWERNLRIVLRQNPNCVCTGLPEKIELKVLPQFSTAIFLFQKNSIDVMKLPVFLLNHPVVRRSKIYTQKGQSVQYIAINNTNKCFDDQFRKALNVSINRKLIISKILEKTADETYAFLPPEYQYQVFGKPRPQPYTYDPGLAKELISRSKCFPEITKNEIDFRMRSDDENRAISLAIAQDLKNSGLRVRIHPMEKAGLYKENGEGKGDLTLLTWYIDYASPMNYIDPLFNSKNFGNGGNRSFYKNPDVDEFILNASEGFSGVLPSDSARITEKISREAPWIFLWSNHENFILSENADSFPGIIPFL
ncbi:MAG: ABC transporter substrate-binding protein [Leptospira sp.]|nr:ABC transporter substrate-binding protein [Leptospira sp.]